MWIALVIWILAPVPRALTASFVTPPETPVRRTNAFKPRQHLRHLAAILGLTLCTICALPAHANITPGVTVTETGGSTVTTEAGGSDIFIVVLDTQPTAAVTIGVSSSDGSEGKVTPSSLTFTAANWDAAQIVTVTGVDDRLEDGDQSYTIVLAAATSTDANYNGVDPNDIAVINVDDDTVGVTVSTNSVLVTEATGAGRTVTYTVVLKTSPTNTVTITPRSDDINVATVSAPLTFTITDWYLPQPVTVTGIHDDIDTGDRTTTISHRASGGGYDSVRIASVGVTLTDDDTAGVTVSKSRVTVTEASGSGHTATYRVGLQSQPTGDVTLTPTSGANSVATVSPASLTFTTDNWETAQQVTVTGVDDRINTDRRTTITHQAAGGGYDSVSIPDVTVTLIDNDKAGVTVSESRVTTTEASGARRTATFTVVLDTPPSADVSIAVTSSDPSEGTVDKSRLVFTSDNWNTAQTVTVTGVNDRIEDGDRSYTIVLAAAVSADAGYRGIDPKDIRVTNVDDDKGPGLILSKSKLETSEGGQQEFLSMRLTRRPTAAVTIAVTSSDTTEGRVAPASLTFTPAGWGEQKVLVVTGEDDDLDDGDQSYTIRLGPAVSADMHYRGFAAAVPATNKDDDAVEVRVSGGGRVMTTEGGGSGRFRVALGSRPVAAVTIAVTSSDPGEGKVAPASLTFTSGDWDQPQEVTVTGEDDVLADRDQDYTIRLGPAVSADVNYNGLDPADIPATNTDNDVAEVTVSVSSVTTTEGGGRGRFRVALGSQPSATVTIAVSSSDPSEGTVDKSRLVFTSGNWDTAQTVTVTGKDDDRADGDRRYTIRLAAAVSMDVNYNGFDPADVLAINTDDDDVGVTASPGAITVTEARGSGHTATYRVVLQSQPSGNVTVTPASGDDSVATVSPASLTFTSSNWKTPQPVTVTGVDDSTDTDRSTSITHSASGGGYGSVSGADVAVTLIDDDGAGVTLSESAVTVDEDGGTATYRVVLDSRPSGHVTITPRSGDINVAMVSAPLTFTAGNWDTAQTVTVTGVDDDFDTDRSTSITHTVSGGGYNPVRIANVAVSLRDDDVAGVTISTSSVTVTKAGRTATYTMVLTSKPTGGGSVRVTPRSRNPNVATPSGSLTFTPSNWDQPQEVTVTGVDDRTDAERATTITHAAAGGGYNSVRIASVSVTLIDDDTAGVTISRNRVTVTEASGSGHTATYRVGLQSQPSGTVTITPASGDTDVATVSPASLTFTTGNWKTAQPVTVTGVDDETDAERSTTITHAASGGGYDSVRIASVSVTLIDNDGAGATVSEAGVTVTETGGSTVTTEAGGSDTFIVVLDTQPTAAVTIGVSSSDGSEGKVTPSSLTFTAANWDAAQIVTVTGVDDRLEDGDQSYTIVLAAATSTDANYNGVDPNDIAVINVDDDTVGVTVSTNSVLVTEATGAGRTVTYTVVLKTSPTNTVTITPRSDDINVATVSAPLTFTITDWYLPQPVTVTGIHDDIDTGDRTTTISHRASGGGYDSVRIASVGVTLTDDDTAGVTVSKSRVTVTEASGSGHTATYRVGLQSQPTGDVTLTPTSGANSVATVSPASLTFTTDNWETAQQVTVTGVDDRINTDRRTTITHQAAGGGYDSVSIPDVTVTLIDNDKAGVTVSESRVTTTEASGARRTATFTVVLDTPPSADVSIAVTSSDPSEGTVDKSRLVFTSDNWNTAQTVTVTGVNDRIEDGDRSYTIVLAAAVSADAGYRGIDPKDIRVTNVDDDKGPGLILSKSKLETSEGGQQEFLSMRLTRRPTAAVTIAVTSSDTTEGRVAPASLTFTPAGWGEQKVLVVTGEDDDLDDGDQSYTIRLGPAVSADMHYRGFAAAVPATNKDDDAVEVRVSGGGRVMTTEGGGSGRFRVALGSRPVAAVTIAVTSSDPGEGKVAPVSLTFTSGDWDQPQEVTVTGEDDVLADRDQDYTIRLGPAVSADMNYNGLDPADIPATNTDNDVAEVTVSVSSVTTTEGGGRGRFRVALGSQPSATVTIAVSSSDPSEGTVDKSRLVFTSGNWDTAQTVTVTGKDDDRADGDRRYTIRLAAAVSMDVNYNGFDPADVLAINTDDDDVGVTASPGAITVTEARGSGHTATYRVVLQSQPSGNVTVTPASGDDSVATVSPASLTFTSSNWKTPQPVTVTGVDDDIDTDRSTSITHSASGGGYGSVSGADVAVTLIDDDGAGVTLSESAVTVDEDGGTATYRVVLDSRPSGHVTITPRSGDINVAMVSAPLTFTAGNWDTAQTVTVTGVDDDFDTDRSTSITHTVSGGGYNPVRIANVAVSLRDDDVAGVTISTSSVTVTKAGRTATYTMVLTSKPTGGGSVRVTPRSRNPNVATPSGSLTFTPSNWDQPQEVTVTGVDDRTDAERATTITHAAAGGGYNSVRIASVSVTLIDDDTAGVTISRNRVTVTEASGSGHTATYRVGLQSQPSGTVTITPASGDTDVATVSPASLTFTTGNWKTAQPVTVTGVDDETDAERSTTITHAASGGGYDSVRIASVSVTLIDNDGAGVTVSEAGVTVTEASGSGHTATYRVGLQSQPTGTVTLTPASGDNSVATVSPASLTFTTGNWDTAQPVTVTGVDDRTDAERSTTISHAITGGGYDSVSIPDVTVTLIDDDGAGVTVSETGVTVTEASGSGHTATYRVGLQSQPTGTVTITPASGDNSVATVSPASLTFTTGNWDTAQPVTVTGVDDETDAERSTTITHTITGGGYDSVSIPDVTVTLIDDDGAGVTVSETGVTVTEASGSGHTATYRVGLQSQPTGTVTITPASGDTDVATVSPASLTFTTGNWDTAQPVTVTGVDDRTDAERSTTISHAASGGGYDSVSIADVTVTLIDNDGAGATVSEAGVTVTEASGSGHTATYRVGLQSQPTGTVTITPASGDTDVATVSPASLTFTTGNWDTAQPVTVTGVDDRTDAERSTTISHAITGGGYDSVSIPDVTVTLIDDDGAGVTVSETGVTVTEASGSGHTATYRVGLQSQPTGTVTLTPASGDNSVATVSPASLTFTTGNWDTAQPVTVTGVDDETDAERSTTISHAITGGGYDSVSIPDVTVTLIDDDGAGVTVSETGVTVTEASGSGHTATYRVGLQSQPTGTVTITPASGDNSVATVSPASLTFTTGNWDTAQPVTVTGVDDETDAERSTTITHTITGGGYDSVSIPDVTVTLIDDDGAGVTVSETGVTVTEASGSGHTATYRVGLQSQPTGTVTLTPASGDTDVATVSPASLTFTTGNWDTAQPVTVTGVDDETDAERSTTISHAITGGGYASVSVPSVSVTLTDDDTAGVTLSETSVTVTEASAGRSTTYTVVLNTRPSGAVTVTPTSGHTGVATVSASLTFTSANWNTVQTITVTGVDDETDGERSTTITHAVSGGGYGSVGITGVSVTLTDNDTAGVTVSETGGGTATTEGGGSDTISVVLDSQPREQVSITVTSSDTGEGTVFPASLTFTPSTWNQPTPVTVTGVDDEVDDGDQAYRIVLAAAASSDATYNGLDASDVAVTNIDDDEAAIVSPAVFEVPENQGAVGTVLAVGGEAVTYAIVGGVDREQFEVDPATGVLTFRAVPDFETPADEASTDPVNDAGNNQYIVGVTAVVQTGEGEKTLEQTIVVTVTDGNDPPVAHAGEGLTVAQGVRVTLDGSGSRDPEGEGLSYAWEPVEAAAAPKIKLEGAETVRPSFTAPSDLAKTIALTFALTVTDTHGERSAAAAVTIRVLVSVAEQDGHVRFAPLRAGEVVVSRGQRITLEVEQGAPAGLGLTLPLEQLGGEAITTITVKRAPTDLPAQPGYRRVSPAVDISLNKGRLSAFPGGATATVCLPLGEPADGVAVYHYEAGTARWAALPLVGGAQPSAVCGATSKFSPFQAFVPIVSDTARAEVSTHWLGRFGRTMASQAVAVIGERLMGGPAGLGTRVTLGGRPVTLRAAAGDDTAGPGARGEWGGGGRGDELAGSGPGRRRRAVASSRSVREVLLGSAVAWSGAVGAGEAEAAEPAGLWTLWAKGAAGGFRGDRLALEGDVVSGWVGVDYADPWGLAGLAVSHSVGRGRFAVGPEAGRGDVRSAVTSLYPYLRWAVDEDMEVWGVVGVGWGELQLKDKRGEVETDVGMRMGAVGARGALSSVGAVALSLKTDAVGVWMDSEAVPGLPAADAAVQRLRLMLTGQTAWAWAAGHRLQPSLEIGGRLDGGDAETGVGLEVGAGLAYEQPALGVSVTGQGRWLAAHQAAGFEAWGASVSARVAPGEAGLGPAFSLTPVWGQAGSGLEAMWESEPGALPGGVSGGRAGPGAVPDRLDVELGYGLRVWDGWGRLTPYGELSLGDGQAQRLHGGLRLAVPGWAHGLEAALFTEQTRRPGAPAESRVGLTGAFRF